MTTIGRLLECCLLGAACLSCTITHGPPPPRSGEDAAATSGGETPRPEVRVSDGEIDANAVVDRPPAYAVEAEPGYCPGATFHTAEVQTCRTHGDCDEGRCQAEPPADSECGGECLEPRVDCRSDGDCDDGTCMAANDPCWCGEGAICIPACTTESCPEAHRCTDGRCEPLSCEDEGVECPDGTRCSPSASVVDPHGCTPVHCRRHDGWECGTNESCRPGAPGNGCVIRDCASDDDCDCGACVLGTCRPAPGVCVAGEGAETP